MKTYTDSKWTVGNQYSAERSSFQSEAPTVETIQCCLVVEHVKGIMSTLGSVEEKSGDLKEEQQRS